MNLKLCKKTNYLGVRIDNSLDWKEHIEKVSSIVSRVIGFQSMLNPFCQKNKLSGPCTQVLRSRTFATVVQSRVAVV